MTALIPPALISWSRRSTARPQRPHDGPHSARPDFVVTWVDRAAAEPSTAGAFTTDLIPPAIIPWSRRSTSHRRRLGTPNMSLYRSGASTAEARRCGDGSSAYPRLPFLHVHDCCIDVRLRWEKVLSGSGDP